MASEERLSSTKSIKMHSIWHDVAQPRLTTSSGEIQLEAAWAKMGPRWDHLAVDGAQEGPNFPQHGSRWSLRGAKMLATGAQNCEACVSFVDFKRYVAKHRFPTVFAWFVAPTGAQDEPRQAPRELKMPQESLQDWGKSAKLKPR